MNKITFASLPDNHKRMGAAETFIIYVRSHIIKNEITSTSMVHVVVDVAFVDGSVWRLATIRA